MLVLNSGSQLNLLVKFHTFVINITKYIKCIFSVNRTDTSIDETVTIHNAYQKEFSRLSKQHQCDLYSLEQCYKEQILFIIQEKDSISLQLLSICQSLNEHFQQKLKKLKLKNYKVIGTSGDKIDFLNETYQSILNSYENKQQDLFKEILELKKVNYIIMKCFSSLFIFPLQVKLFIIDIIIYILIV